jgi:alcohol oxidase
MFHFLEYPFSRGSVNIRSASPYENPDFDSGFMNHKADMAPMVWAYKKSRETARRMSAFAGEVTSLHPHYKHNSPAHSFDINIAEANAIGGPGNLTAGLQHGSWARALKDALPKGQETYVTSNRADVRDEIKYSKEDDAAIEDWVRDHVGMTL